MLLDEAGPSCLKKGVASSAAAGDTHGAAQLLLLEGPPLRSLPLPLSLKLPM